MELRICDACPRLEDVLCIAGLFRHLVQGLAVDHYDATPVNREVRWITQENYWRAKRHGRHGQFIGVHDQAQVTAEGWLAQLLAQFPADTLDAQRAALEAQRILREGTSADRQLHCLEQARSGGRDVRQALHAVVDQVLAEGAQQSASNPVGE